MFPTFSVNYKQQPLSSLGVKVHSDHIGPLVWREKVITNNDIAIVDIDCHGNSILVHDTPLIAYSKHQPVSHHKMSGMLTYRGNLVRQKLPLHQPSKGSTIRNQKIIFDKREPRIDVSPIRFRASIVTINGDIDDCIVNQAISRDVGVVERGSGKVAVVGFVSNDLLLFREVVNVAGCYMGEIGVPVRGSLANIRTCVYICRADRYHHLCWRKLVL